MKNDDHLYCPPTGTTAGLMFPARSRETVRGFTLARTPGDGHWRQFIYMSQGERETCLLLLAEPGLRNLWDQPRPVSFIDADGRQRSHRFDFLAEFTDGQRVAVAVKPSEQVERLGFQDTLKRIRHDLPMGFADRVYLVTEKERHPIEVLNADLLNQFRRNQDEEADATVADMVAELLDEVTVADLIARSGLGDRGFQAVFRSIYSGQLLANRRELISLRSRVAPLRRAAA
ncbi:MAG: hypothetical protein ACPGNV_12225 [Mangrovicoccus sp.]